MSRNAALLLLGLLAVPAQADEQPLLRMELRVATGFDVDAPKRARAIPISFGAGGEHAILAQPWTSVYGHLFVEGPDAFVGGVGSGLRVRDGSLRLSAGSTMIVSPALMAGATAMVGGCFVAEVPRLCIDVEGTMFFAGAGVPEGGSGQVKLVLGVGFDVL